MYDKEGEENTGRVGEGEGKRQGERREGRMEEEKRGGRGLMIPKLL